MANVLIIRISAIGDVAMTIPVIYAVAKANPENSFTVLTQKFLTTLFINRPANVEVVGIDTKGSEKTFWGLLRFSFVLTKKNFDFVLDLHDVIRSRIISTVFFLKGKRVFRIDKGRKERKLLTQKPPKTIKPLPTMVSRYAEVFRQAGFQFDETFVSLYQEQPVDMSVVRSIAGTKEGRWIGIAPFAKHREKIYSVDKMEEIVVALSKQPHTHLFLFGGKGYEEALLDEWAFQYMNVESMAGKYSLDQELALISQLDVLICMDSANMHFASLVGTPVISIWGATHPYAGFYGYRQSPDRAIQIDLSCRPCSIFGNKPCHRGDWACMTHISTEQILDKIKSVLDQKVATL